MRTLLLAVGLALGLVHCATAQNGTDRLQPAEFKAAIAQPGVQLVDVRTPEEYAKGHLAGAVNIDWLGTDFAAGTAALDKSRPILLYCAAGGRSEEALAAVKKAGFTKAKDMLGGINAWKKAGLPVTDK